MKKWFAQAPANVALIKYMGKSDDSTNLPSNSSLSYTLSDLLSFVELEQTKGVQDSWEVLQLPGAESFSLSPTAEERFLRHLQLMKTTFGYEGIFIVRSCNNFPMSTGLASSASSFAALTIAANRALSELTGRDELSETQMADLSRQGSGSSCRSFFSPFALWDQTGTRAVTDLGYSKFIHHAVLVSHTQKTVASTDAHTMVNTSPHFASRTRNAEHRLITLMQTLREKNWLRSYELVREDFLEMHSLFKTAKPSFDYITAESQQVLNDVQDLWHKHKDGPLVTMDAGPNVHVLFREDQQSMANKFKDLYIGVYDVL